MSDININGIPNMGFAGGGGGMYGFGGIPNAAPAWSSADIMRSIYGNYSPGQAQATQNNIYGGGGFGALTNYYAALSAAHQAAATRTPYPGAGAYNDAAGLPQSPAPYYQDPNAAPTGYNPFDSATYQLWQPQTYAPAPRPAPQPAANPYAAWYAGLPGGGQAYNSWNMGLPGQGGFGVPGAQPAPQPAPQIDFNALYGNRAGMLPNAYSNSAWMMGTPAATPAASWYGGLPGGGQAYNSWNMGLPAQGGLGVPGSGGGGPGMYANDPFGGMTGAGG